MLKILEIWRFFNFIFATNHPLSPNFKNVMYVLEELLKNVCTKFQIIPFINVVFIAFLMLKNCYFFRAFGRIIMQFHIFI